MLSVWEAGGRCVQPAAPSQHAIGGLKCYDLAGLDVLRRRPVGIPRDLLLRMQVVMVTSCVAATEGEAMSRRSRRRVCKEKRLTPSVT